MKFPLPAAVVPVGGFDVSLYFLGAAVKIRRAGYGSPLGWALRISSGVGEGIHKPVVQGDWEFLRIGVGCGQ